MDTTKLARLALAVLFAALAAGCGGGDGNAANETPTPGSPPDITENSGPVDPGTATAAPTE